MTEDARLRVSAGDGLVLEPPYDAIGDPRIRRLLMRYAELSRARLADLSENLVTLEVPRGDQPLFGKRDRVIVAFSIEALEQHPQAEMAVLGSVFVEQLIDAIRARGARLSVGLVAPSFSAGSSAAPLTVPVRNGSASEPSVSVARHLAGRLHARVLPRAGPEVEEHLVESGWFDFTTGAPLLEDVASCCMSVERLEQQPAPVEAAGDARLGATKPLDELVHHMITDLQARLTSDVQRLHVESERALSAELARIDRYYRAMLDEEGLSGEERRTLASEHERRVTEERRRHSVRAVVHPLQVVEAELLVQRAEWTISTPAGVSGRLVAHRALSGQGAWSLACPACACAPPAGLVVCRNGHVACDACALVCSVCDEQFCRAHGKVACHVDSAPACAEHARTCSSCRRVHCLAHEGTCSEGDHPACTECLSGCAICGKAVCGSHAIMTAANATLGVRRLCAQCTVHCEGGRSEPVGRDEVRRCASCDRYVCTVHQAVCVVDEQVHCSAHLRRTDRSRRLVCTEHRAACSYEPEVIFASDEVLACVECGAVACKQHAASCVEDRRWHCRSHLSELRDLPGALACEAHRTVCHMDGVAFSLGGTSACPVCERLACRGHLVSCGNCRREVCSVDWSRGAGRCSTCEQLRSWADPSDDAIAAVLEANSGVVPGVKEWRAARDSTHVVIELVRGWTRRTVLAVRHGDSRAARIVGHSALGSSEQR